jgi:thioredoxin reductase (NADPH)
MADTQHDVIVIGCGVAGLAAARQALEDGLRVAALEALLPGGLITNVNQLDGPVSGSGAEIAAIMMDEAVQLGLENLEAQATGLQQDGDGWLVTSDGGVHGARAVIIACGARLKKLGVPGEDVFEHKGVSHCADCDGPMMGGQDVAVVGGGDSALQSALSLAGYCREVHLIHRGTAFGARSHLAAAVADTGNICIHWSAEVAALLGDDQLTAVRVTDRGTGAVSELAVAGFFAFVGLDPACDFVPADLDLERDAKGFLVTDEARQTRRPGLYAAGAVRVGCGGLVSDAIEDGRCAAQSAARSLKVAA